MCGHALWSALNPDAWRRQTQWAKIGNFGYIFRPQAELYLESVPNEKVHQQILELIEQPDVPVPIRGAYRAYPLSSYIKRKYKGKIFALSADELHQYNNHSGQGDAMQELLSAAKKMVGMTATLVNGYMQDGRRFAMIHFAGENHFQTDRFLPGQFNREDILQAAELFLSGGTSYATPLKEALRLMEEEGFQNADMLFITDGKCALPPDFLKHLDQEKAQRGFRITGVLLDQDDEGFAFSLAPFCEKILRTSQLAQEQIEDELMAVVC